MFGLHERFLTPISPHKPGITLECLQFFITHLHVLRNGNYAKYYAYTINILCLDIINIGSVTNSYDLTVGYLLLLGDYQIYFIECVEKIRNPRVRSTRKISMFSAHEMTYTKLVFTDFFILLIINILEDLRLIIYKRKQRSICDRIVGNPNRKKMHIFGFVGIFEYIC